MSFAIEVNHVTKSFGSGKKKVDALRGVTFGVKKGEIFGLLGPNGAGKSTLTNILSGIVSYDSGTISILGKEPDDAKQTMNVAAAFSHLSGILSIEQNLLVYAKLYNVKEPRRKVEELLRTFNLWEIRKQHVYKLSSGQETRVNLCKGLINNPKVLLMDEATVGLDPEIAFHTRQLIKKLRDEKQTTILFTSHNMAEVEELCDRIAFLHQGKILRIDTATGLKKLIGRQIVRIDVVPTRKSLPNFVKRYALNTLHIGRYHLDVIAELGKGEIHRILHPLFAEGFEIRDLIVEKPSLEEVFLTIAKTGERK